MTELSDEQKQKRAERARQNGSKSRGPTSVEGAARSKLNGLKEGGLRAATYPLPGEEDADVAEQAGWNARYQPRSPAAAYHARQCARASVMAERCERFARARIADQKRRAVRNFQRRGPRRVKRILARITEDRLGAIQALAEFSDGCRELARLLAGSIELLSSRGYLLPAEIEGAIGAHGIWPVPQSLPRDVTAYRLYILNLGCTPGVAPAELDARLDPASRPLALRVLPREALLPTDPSVRSEHLRALIQQKCDEYAAEAERLEEECDVPELARMLEQAEMLSDADLKRWNRCHAEQRLTVRASEQALYKALDRDREVGDVHNEDPGPVGGGGSEESPDREDEAETAVCAGQAGDSVAQGEVEALGPEPQAACGLPLPEPPAARGQPFPGEEKFSPREPRIAPEAARQTLGDKEDPAEDQGAEQGVPICVPGGATHDHDAAPLPATPSPPPAAGVSLHRRFRSPPRGGWVPR
jgi:hypothetical protein